MGMGIGFGGVVIIFMLWKRSKNWVIPPNMTRPFFGYIDSLLKEGLLEVLSLFRLTLT